MSVSIAAWLLGGLLVLSSACISIPQVARTLRTGTVAGLSVTSCVAFCAGWSMWLTYSVSIGSWPQVATQGIGLMLQVVLVAAVLRTLGRASGSVAAAAALLRASAVSLLGVAGCVVVWQWWGWSAFPYAVAVFDAVFVLPQVLTVVRSADLSGLSPVSYVMRLVFASGWLGYGALIGHLEASASSWLWLVFSFYVLWRLRPGVGASATTAPTADPYPATSTRTQQAAAPVSAGADRLMRRRSVPREYSTYRDGCWLVGGERRLSRTRSRPTPHGAKVSKRD